MQKILDFISSKTFRNVMCFIVFTFLVTVTISSQNYFFQKVIENGISKKDIIAQKDIKVIDTKKTELHKKEAAQAVEPILTQAEDDFITSSLTTLQKSVVKIRAKDVSDEIKEDELSVLFDESGRRGVIEFLLKSSDSDLYALFDKCKVVLAGVLNTGISNKDFENNNVTEIIRKNIPNTTPRSQITLITSVLNQVIVPNLVVDEFATEIARKNAANAVKPYEVSFKKGSKIVFEGEPVTKLKRDALRAAGYNVLEVNLQERNVRSIWQINEKFHPIDDDGNVIDAPFKPQKPILLIVGEGAPQNINKLLSAIDGNKKVFERVKVANYISNRRWNLVLDDIENGITIKLPEENIEQAWKKLLKLDAVNGILKRKLTIIDLRLKGKVTVKLKKIDGKAPVSLNKLKEHRV